MTTPLWSEKWAVEVIQGEWEPRIDESGPARIESVSLRSPDLGISYARGCILTVPGKFFAETLLVYPSEGRDFPIFGSEYIEMANRYFGATDFHPPNGDNRPIEAFFPDFPPREVQSSRHYDLDTYFSTKLWHKRSDNPFYEDFVTVCYERLRHYVARLPANTGNRPDFTRFDRYMADHDPAHGILKSYFGAEFANDYIRTYLFPHGDCD